MKKLYILILLSSMLLTSCMSDKRNLQLVESLVEDELSNDALQVRYRAPKGFHLVNQSYTDSIANAELLQDGFAPIILAIHVDTIVGGSMMLSDIRYIPEERINKDIKNYKETYNQHNTWKKVNRISYSNNNFEVVEIICENDTYILTKLFFYEEKKPAFVVDYFVPLAVNEKYTPLINSSIASFEKGYTLIFN
jgi:hypothetical protein